MLLDSSSMRFTGTADDESKVNSLPSGVSMVSSAAMPELPIRPIMNGSINSATGNLILRDFGVECMELEYDHWIVILVSPGNSGMLVDAATKV